MLWTRRLPAVRSVLALLLSHMLCSGTVRAQLPEPEDWFDRPVTVFDRGTLFSWDGSENPGGVDFDEPLTTDRPDFTEASSTVGKGVLQIESGYTFIEDREAGIRNHEHSFGEFLFRYGVAADWLELRLGVAPSHTRASGAGFHETSTSLENLYLGTKLALAAQDEWLPELALTPQMQVPVGPNPSNDVLPGVNLLYSWDIDEDWSLSGNTQLNRAVDDDGKTILEASQSVAVGYGWTDRLGSYAETFAFFPEGTSSGSSEYYFNGGFTYLLSNDIQLDIRSGLGLNRQADDFFAGAGLSMRFH